MAVGVGGIGVGVGVQTGEAGKVGVGSGVAVAVGGGGVGVGTSCPHASAGMKKRSHHSFFTNSHLSSRPDGSASPGPGKAHFTVATTSISTNPPAGSAATCTVERAGGSSPKNSP